MSKNIKMWELRLLVTILFFGLNAPYIGFAQGKTPFFKNKDVICFLGDSITHGGQYHEFLQLFYATRYPELKLSFHNCGVSGDNSTGMIERLEEDVIKHNPTHVFVMTGMNDVNRVLYFEGTVSDSILTQRANALATYKQNTTLLAEKIFENNAKPIFLTPSIYDQYSKIEKENNLGCNDALIECSNHLKKLGVKYGALVIDLNTPMRKIMEHELKKDSLFNIIGKDRVHPSSTGHFIMFDKIISTLESESLISKIGIDLNNPQCSVSSENVTLHNIYFSDTLISFQANENSLPYPLDDSLNKALSLTSFRDIYNRQLLQVDGLKDGMYNLFITNALIGRFSSQELSTGLNLAKKTNTPQYKQAQEIKRLCSAYRQTQYRLRAVAFIRHSYLNDYTGPEDISPKQQHLAKKLESIADKPYYNYIKRSINDYFETLPKVDSLLKRKRELSEQIHLFNNPKKQEWILIKK